MAAAKMYTELCTKCGTEVKFDAELIRQDNPYWPWIDSKQLTDLTATVQKLTSQLTNLTDVLRNPGGGLIAQIMGLSENMVTLNGTIRAPEGGLIAQIATLVECFHMLISPAPIKPLEKP